MRKNWDAPVTQQALDGEADNVKMKLKIGNTTVRICDDSYISHTPEEHKQRWENFSRIVMENAMRAGNTKVSIHDPHAGSDTKIIAKNNESQEGGK